MQWLHVVAVQWLSAAVWQIPMREVAEENITLKKDIPVQVTQQYSTLCLLCVGGSICLYGHSDVIISDCAGQIACGTYFAACLMEDRSVFTWGESPSECCMQSSARQIRWHNAAPIAVAAAAAAAAE